MSATAAIAVLMFAGAAAFASWLAIVAVRGMWNWYRAGPPSRMARRITDRPRHDSRDWQGEFRRINRP